MINMTRYLGNDTTMAEVSLDCTKRSKGVLKGVIGALDGWLVRIVRSGWKRDTTKNPTTFFSKTGFYVLNYQCIVDDRKRYYGFLILIRVGLMILIVYEKKNYIKIL